MARKLCGSSQVYGIGHNLCPPLDDKALLTIIKPHIVPAGFRGQVLQMFARLQDTELGAVAIRGLSYFDMTRDRVPWGDTVGMGRGYQGHQQQNQQAQFAEGAAKHG